MSSSGGELELGGEAAPSADGLPSEARQSAGGDRASKREREALVLRLDSSKAEERLGWSSRWPVEEAAARTAAWYRAWADGEELQRFTLAQLAAYVSPAAAHQIRSV